ncbi:MAG TPA: protein kinase [Pyrinomonadaceae bacterium]
MKYCTVCKSKYDDSVSFCPTDGEVLEDDPSSIVGTVLDGQYKIESLLGKGGMGAVYLARHILLGDRVAIKILPPEVRNNAEWLRRFRREGQAARRFRHANAVTVYDLRTAGDGTIYMVMEYVEGHTLDAELKKHGRFTAAEAFEILEPIMSVLNTAHAMGVVHRDLKPENIMMGKATSSGESPIKLLDLGIAKMREIAGVDSSGTTELTMAGQVLGTPYYMSPEQWGEISRDGNPEIDGRTDIYSLGLVAYEMISGKRPYTALTLHELRREHISVSPTSLWEKVPDVPRAFSEAIDRAISKDRGDRQATAGELAAQLRTGLGDTSSQAPAGRTLPDMPYPESSRAQTRGSSGAVDTKSDVNAATIVTIDAVPTTPPSIPAPVAPLPRERPEQQKPRVSAADDMASSVTVLQAPKKPADLTGPQKSRGKPLLFIGAAVLLLILVVVGVGGFFAVNWLKAKPDDSSSTTDRNRKTTKVADLANPGTATEFGRYWLEVLPNASVTQPMRVAGAVPLASGQAFKFHFEFGDNGFLYIIGPGERNQLTAFLTAKPKAISGLETNQVTKGADFSFPSGDEHWLELDKKPGTENYTLIFSPEPLSVPAFLSAEATGKPLSETEQADLSDFLAKSKTSEPVTEINDKDAAAPFVAVRVAQSEGSGAPVVFQVRIQHK